MLTRIMDVMHFVGIGWLYNRILHRKQNLEIAIIQIQQEHCV